MDSWQSDKTSSIHCNVSILIRTFRNGRSPTYAKNSAITLVELCLTSLFNLLELFKDGSRTQISRNCYWEYNMRVFTMTGWAPSEVMVYKMCTTTVVQHFSSYADIFELRSPPFLNTVILDI